MKRLLTFLPALLIALPAAAAPPESMGAWVMQCPGGPRPACVLRHQERLFDKAGLSADLEVRGIGAAVVPVVAVRGLPSDPLLAMALGDRVKASVQFPGAAPTDLTCSAADGGYVCAPKESAAAALSAALQAARSVTVRVSVMIPGADGGPSQSRSLDLSGTNGALARLRTMGVAAAPALPQEIPPGWARLIDRTLKAAGYTGGSADLQAMLARYLRR